MTNLGEVYLLCNLITNMSWEHLNFFTGLKVVTYRWMIKTSKWVEMSNRGRIKYQRVGSLLFFPCYQSKIMSHFVPVIPVSPDTTLKEKYLG